MLYSVIVGECPVDNNWELSTDEYGRSFIGNKSLHQRIRFGQKVKPVLTKVGDNYELPKNTFFSNNNKNMNLNIINFFSKDKEVMNNHADENILYLTFSCKDYKVLDYTTDAEILQTYRNKHDYVGAAIVFDTESEIITVRARNNKTNRFVIFTVVYKDGNVTVEESTGMSVDTVKALASIAKKQQNFDSGFKMKVNSGILVTNTYIVDEAHFDQIKELTKNIKNASIICLSDSRIDSYDDEMKDVFKEYITDMSVRAVTLYGVTLPKTFCKDFRILYMFKYNPKTNTMECVRSN